MSGLVLGRPHGAVGIEGDATRRFEGAAGRGQHGRSSPVVATSQARQCKEGKCVPGCADLWHLAARWVGQAGNYAKLTRWIEAEMPDDGTVPFRNVSGAGQKTNGAAHGSDANSQQRIG